MAHITLSIGSNANEVSLLAAAVRGALGHLRISPEDVAAVNLGMVEAVNNCIEHAYQHRPDGDVTVRCRLDDSTLELRVANTGRPLLKLPPAKLPAPDSENGRGWFIIHACFDHIEHSSDAGVNTVTLQRRLR